MVVLVRKYLFILFILFSFSSIIGCDILNFFIPSGNSSNSIYIEKTSVCKGEDILISIKNDSENSKNKIYNIHNHTGKKAIIKFSTSGQKKVSITEKNLLTQKIKNREIGINVENCQADGVITITSNPDKSNLGVFNFKADISPHLVQDYKWDFGDGTIIKTNNQFISHDFRMRKQDEYFSSFIVKVSANGLDGQEYIGRTSLSMTNTDLISHKLGNPTIPVAYNRFPQKTVNGYYLDITINNIYSDTFIAETLTFKFKNHISESTLQKLTFSSEEMLGSSSFAGNQQSNVRLNFPKSIVPQNATRINLYIKGPLGQGQNAISKIYLDISPENNELANSQGFEEVTSTGLINRLEEAEKIYGQGTPITIQKVDMLTGNYQNNTNISGRWVFIPTKAHDLKKGDVILTKDTESILSSIFNNLGIVWDHTLMVIDDNGTMRHNTMEFSEELEISGIEMKDYTFRVYDPYDYILVSKESFSLPELIKKNTLEGFPPGILNAKRSPDKFRVKLTTSNENNRQFLQETADEIIKMEGNYILNSYINIEAYEPTSDNITANTNQGSQCSGTIWWANKRSGLTMDIPVIHQPEVVLFAATNVYNTFLEYFTDMLIIEMNNQFDSINGYKFESDNILSIILNFGIGSVEDYIKDSYKDQIMKHLFETHNIPEKFANQITNTFLFNRADDTSDYWRYHYEEVDITSISPDDLLLLSIPELSLEGDANSNYNLLENYTEGGGYYIKIK